MEYTFPYAINIIILKDNQKLTGDNPMSKKSKIKKLKKQIKNRKATISKQKSKLKKARKALKKAS